MSVPLRQIRRNRADTLPREDYIYIAQNTAEILHSFSSYTVQVLQVSEYLHEFLVDYAKIFVNVEVPTPDGYKGKPKIIPTKNARKIGKAMLTHEGLEIIPSSTKERYSILAKNGVSVHRTALRSEYLRIDKVWPIYNMFLHGGDIEIIGTLNKDTEDDWRGRFGVLLNTGEEEIKLVRRGAEESYQYSISIP